MGFQKVTSGQRQYINALVGRANAAGLTETVVEGRYESSLSFSQVLKYTADWKAAIEAAEQAKATVAARPADAVGIIATLRAAGRSVREIAAAVGVHSSTVYRWSRGAFRPQPQRLAALAAI